MQELLIRKLHDYIRDNNLDVYVRLQLEGGVTSYLQNKVNSVDALFNKLLEEEKSPRDIEEVCMHQLTEDLRPSAYNFLSEILLEEFETVREQWQKSGVLEFETINLIEACSNVFAQLGFNEESIENKQLRFAVIGNVQQYLDNRK